jgi:oxygen-independent coproporphyrinogen-3 oxidase
VTESLSQTTSLYFHIPFCIHRCAYCDFNTYAGRQESIPAYVQAMGNEIREVGKGFHEDTQVHTVFFGGGTPSLLSVSQYEDIFRSIQDNFQLLSDSEISLEANPGTCTLKYLKALRSLGFNRISFGVQSANPNELRILERIHDYGDVVDAVKWSRQAGFGNLNLDLIYGLPEQTLSQWQNSLNLTLGLNPEHLSLYALTLEHGTPFGRWADRGLLPVPDPDVAAEMYEWAGERLALAGYEQYEISNWSKPGRQCRHNLQYWRNLTYLGFGAGAHGYGAGYRYSNVLHIKKYISRMTDSNDEIHPFPLSSANVNQHRNSAREDMQETMMTGLRLTREGVSTRVFAQRFNLTLSEAFGDDVEDLLRLELVEWVDVPQAVNDPDRRLRLTKRGRLLGNQVFMRFVGD